MNTALTVLGGTSGLSPAKTAMITGHLRTPAGDHRWPDVISSGQFGGWLVAVTLVEPEMIAEVSSDTAHMSGRRRHALRFIRLRLD